MEGKLHPLDINDLSFKSGSRKVLIRKGVLQVIAGTGNIVKTFPITEGIMLLGRNGNNAMLVRREAGNELKAINHISEVPVENNRGGGGMVPPLPPSRRG